MFRKGAAVLLIISLFFSGCGRKKTEINNKNDNNAGESLTVKSFLFVGMSGKKPGLFKYDLSTNKYSQFWNSPKESVLDLSCSKDMKTAFFLTAQSYGRQGDFPFVKDVKVYLIDLESSRVQFVESIGSGVQVFTAWGTDNTFKVVLNSFDSTIVNYINQRTQIFNTYGKTLFDEEKTFDFTKEGYPKPSEVESNYISSSDKYSIEISDSTGRNKIFLKQNSSAKKFLIADVSQNLNQVCWSPDGQYIFLSTLNISSSNKTLEKKEPNTSMLLIYSINRNKVIKSWEGGGLKNFFVVDNFLIFDDGFDSNSNITIFNYKKLNLTGRIEVNGGCGLRNIPTIPDYKVK
jgi:hypothetical protein